MYLETRKIKDIHPYPGNPRINRDAVQPVMESIQKDGYRARIMVDANGVIIAGHTRFAAIKKLGWKEVEVWVADDMTEEQVRDYRIRDNYTAEFAEWDFDQLEREIQGLDFDMTDFGMEPEQEPDDDDGGDDDYEYVEEPISRLTHNVFENFEHPFEPTYVGKYDIPVMQPTQTTGENFLRFCDWRGIDDPENYIAHFYYDDFKFINAWRDPECYVERLRRFKAVIAPDFSLYTDFPLVLQILSCYRRQWVGAYWQSIGIDVIPDVIWGDENSYEFCFDGLPKHSTVAVSSVGVKRDSQWNGKEDNLFVKGYNEMMRRLEPTAVLFYGDKIDGLPGNIIHIPSFYAQRRDALNEMKRIKREQQ